MLHTTNISLHYVKITVLIKHCRISVVLSDILSTLMMNLIYKLLIVYKRMLNRHKNRILINN